MKGASGREVPWNAHNPKVLHSFVKGLAMKKNSTAIAPQLLIQVASEKMCIKYWLITFCRFAQALITDCLI